MKNAISLAAIQKEFDDISVQDIADVATLNRDTFYLHYTDKNTLLEAMTEARFQELVSRCGQSLANCDSALRAIALGVCDYLTETTSCPGRLARMPPKGSIIPVVESIFREGAATHAVKPGVDADVLATTAAWAIFGAARRWYQTSDRIPAEEVAAKIEAMVKPIFLGALRNSPYVTARKLSAPRRRAATKARSAALHSSSKRVEAPGGWELPLCDPHHDARLAWCFPRLLDMGERHDFSGDLELAGAAASNTLWIAPSSLTKGMLFTPLPIS